MYSDKYGYVPDDFDTNLQRVIDQFNIEFGTDYNHDTFRATNFYRYSYPLIQSLMVEQNNFKTIWEKLRLFIRESNEKILQPPLIISGLIQKFKDNNLDISIRPLTTETAGILAVCVDTDPNASDFADKKQLIGAILRDTTTAGLYYEGDQTVPMVLLNGQVWDFSFYTPTLTDLYIKLTVSISRNNNVYAIDDIDTIKQKLLNNLGELYRVGLDFEPEKYYEIVRDAQYASNIILEWSEDNVNYSDEVKQQSFNEKLAFNSDNIFVSFD
jgi:hypothetical protein